MAQYDTEMKEVRTQLQQSEPLVHQLRDRLAGEEQLLTEQGGKLGEFRTSLVDYQQVLASLRQHVAQQEQQVAELRKQVELTGQKQDVQGQQVQANFEEVRRSIQSVVGTLEKVSTTFGGRLDEHEQKLSRVAGQQGGPLSSNAPMTRMSDLSARSAESRDLLSTSLPILSVRSTWIAHNLRREVLNLLWLGRSPRMLPHRTFQDLPALAGDHHGFFRSCERARRSGDV